MTWLHEEHIAVALTWIPRMQPVYSATLLVAWAMYCRKHPTCDKHLLGEAGVLNLKQACAECREMPKASTPSLHAMHGSHSWPYRSHKRAQSAYHAVVRLCKQDSARAGISWVAA